MKIKEGYLLREVAGQHVVVPVGAAALDFNGVISLNGAGSYLWGILEKGASEKDLVEALLSRYEVSREGAEADVVRFLEKLRKHALLSEHD